MTRRRALAVELVAELLLAGCAVIVYGYSRTLGLAMLPLVAILSAAVPALVARTHKRSSTSRQPTTRSLLEDWSDAELYAVWLATAKELLRTPHAADTATAAEARQALLAEIERRHPAATEAWLSSDNILSGEPPLFLKAHS